MHTINDLNATQAPDFTKGNMLVECKGFEANRKPHKVNIRLVSIEDGLDNIGFRKIAAYTKSLHPDTKVAYVTTGNLRSLFKILTEKGIDTNVTLVFSASQALMAAKAGATYVSPFIGRIDDTGADGMQLIAEIMQTWESYPEITTKVLAASIRHPTHVLSCMQLGAHTVTMPAKIFRQLMTHPLTDRGLDGFLKDWAEVEAAGNA